MVEFTKNRRYADPRMFPRNNVDPKNPSFSNIWELQPLLLKLSDNAPEDLQAMSCEDCAFFAINPRQCCYCKNLTCMHCAYGTPPDGEIPAVQKDPVTGHPVPDICVYCKTNSYVQGTLNPPNVLEGKQQKVLFKISFRCPYNCGRSNFNIKEIQEHAIWFCPLKPFEVKAQLIERAADMQERVVAQKFEFLDEIKMCEEFYMGQIQTLLDEMDDLSGVNQQLQDTIEENEQRLRALEKRAEQIGSKDRIFQVMKMKMLADKINPAGFEQFEFVLPKEALTLATEEALERGLLTKLEIGTRQNIRSLTSIKMTFNNGRRDYVSPRFGVNDEAKVLEFKEPVRHILGCHFRDHTCFVCFNEDLELSHGAQRNDVRKQILQLQYQMRETQQIVGVYGWRLKDAPDGLDIVWQFSFILNNDF